MPRSSRASSRSTRGSRREGLGRDPGLRRRDDGRRRDLICALADLRRPRGASSSTTAPATRPAQSRPRSRSRFASSARRTPASRPLAIAGSREAQGELIAFCDADDVLLPRHLEALVATYEASEGGLATSNCYWLFPGGIHPSRTRYKGGFPRPERQRLAILEQNFVSTMSLFPKALAEEIGPFDEELAVAEDWDFWLRAIYAGRRVALQPRAVRALPLGRRGSRGRREADGRARGRRPAKGRGQERSERRGARLPRAPAQRPGSRRAGPRR